MRSSSTGWTRGCRWPAPYARLARWNVDRLVAVALALFLVAALAAVAGGKAWPDPWHMVLFFIGAVAMRGAGCTYNDLVDVDIDSKVERTRSRPIPAGQVSRLQAKIFLGGPGPHRPCGAAAFQHLHDLAGHRLAAAGSGLPVMKRITNWPQLFLGFAFSWGALMGWAAALWVPVLVTVVSLYRRHLLDDRLRHDLCPSGQGDDALVGVKSTARLFDEHTKPALILLYSCATALFFLAAIFADAGPAAFIGILAGVIHLGWQIVVLDIDDGDQCLQLFRSNGTYGWILFFGSSPMPLSVRSNEKSPAQRGFFLKTVVRTLRCGNDLTLIGMDSCRRFLPAGKTAVQEARTAAGQ